MSGTRFLPTAEIVLLAVLAAVTLLVAADGMRCAQDSATMISRVQGVAVGMIEGDVIARYGEGITIVPAGSAAAQGVPAGHATSGTVTTADKWAIPSQCKITGKIRVYYYVSPAHMTGVHYVYLSRDGRVECAFQTGT